MDEDMGGYNDTVRMKVQMQKGKRCGGKVSLLCILCTFGR